MQTSRSTNASCKWPHVAKPHRGRLEYQKYLGLMLQDASDLCQVPAAFENPYVNTVCIYIQLWSERESVQFGSLIFALRSNRNKQS